MIQKFSGSYKWLSNFAPVEIELDGRIFLSVEHAYVSAKNDNETWKSICTDDTYTAAQIKQLGRDVVLVDDWDIKRLEVMRYCIFQKFYQEPYKSKLLATMDQNIQEGNTWEDKFWGIDLKTGVGENHLGRLIMEARSSFK